MRYSQVLSELRDRNQRQLQRLRSGRRELDAGFEWQGHTALAKSHRSTDQTSGGGRNPEGFVIGVSPGRRSAARATGLRSPARDREATRRRLDPGGGGGPAWLAFGTENIQPDARRGAVRTSPVMGPPATVNLPRSGRGSLTRTETPSQTQLAAGSHHLRLTPFRRFPASRQARQPVANHGQSMAPSHWATSAARPEDCSRFSPSFSQGGWPGPGAGTEAACCSDRLLTEGNKHETEPFRQGGRPKSILAAAGEHAARASIGQVTFSLPDEEQVPRVISHRGDGSPQPLLGYDWIAGLMDIDSSLSERSEQYFTELQHFRRVNKEECIRGEYMDVRAGQRDPGTSEWNLENEELDPSQTPHQCCHSYRVNSRLFATPLNPEAACPVCKIPKAKRPHTQQEPAYIRVSIPRSTLLAPYKYRAHRRKSFDASDSLSLPSHCLLGWESARPAITPAASSLDLHSCLSLGAAPSGRSFNTSNLSWAASRVTGGTRSDELLDVSRSAHYQLQRLMDNQP